MDNVTSIEAVQSSLFSERFIAPLHSSYCFSRLPGTICNLFEGGAKVDGLPADILPSDKQHYQKVVLLFFDAFGWMYWDKYTLDTPHPVAKELRNQGCLSQLTSQFPSATAAHVTTIHTGLSVGEHGVCDWNYYCKSIDTVMNPFFFSSIHDSEPEALHRRGIKPAQVFQPGWFYSTLENKGIHSSVHQDKQMMSSTFNRFLLDQPNTFGFSDYRMGLSELAERLLNCHDRSFLHYYFGEFDHIMHHTGAHSSAADSVAGDFLENLKICFLDKVRGKVDDCLFLMVADHGMVDLDSESVLYLDCELPEICACMKRDSVGRVLAPCGTPRDLFLHLEPEKVDWALDYLRNGLQSIADVFTVQELVELQFFSSNKVSQVFEENIGTLVIVPHRGKAVYWAGDNQQFKTSLKGQHGGLSPDEMTIGLLSLEL